MTLYQGGKGIHLDNPTNIDGHHPSKPSRQKLEKHRSKASCWDTWWINYQLACPILDISCQTLPLYLYTLSRQLSWSTMMFFCMEWSLLQALQSEVPSWCKKSVVITYGGSKMSYLLLGVHHSQCVDAHQSCVPSGPGRSWGVEGQHYFKDIVVQIGLFLGLRSCCCHFRKVSSSSAQRYIHT